MKNTIILFALLVGFQFSNAQNSFKETNEYSITSDIKNKNEEYAPYTLNLVNSNDTSKKITTFIISEIDLFEDVFISTLKKPGLDGVSEIIKIEIEYLACCANVESYYIIVTEDHDYISLPKLDNVYCENTDEVLQYNFPSQEYGIEGSITKNEVSYTDIGEIKNINTIQNFTLHDDDFGSTETIATIEF